MTVSWFRTSHRLVLEQMYQLTAHLLTAHEDRDLDEEELRLLLSCRVEDAAANLFAPISVCLDQLDKGSCVRRVRRSFVPDCFLLQFSLFLCCPRRRFPADFLERPAKRSG